MKKNLFLFCLTILALNFSKLRAQCTITDPSIDYNYSLPVVKADINDPDSCDVNFDFSFDFDNNNGNKRVFIHFWTPADYPNPALTYADAPTATDLALSLGTIHIEDPGTTADLDPTYIRVGNEIPGVNVLFNGLTLTRIPGPPDRYIISNITLRLPGICGPAAVVKGDVWGSQNNGDVPSCTTLEFELTINDPTADLYINCADESDVNDPQTYDLVLSTTQPDAFNVVYRIYVDNGDENFIPPGSPNSDSLIFTSDSITLSDGNPQSFIDIPYLTQADPAVFDFLKRRQLWIRLSAAGAPNVIIGRAVNPCFILPVKLISFEAARDDKYVNLEWKTAEEINNAGFEIQKINLDGTTQMVAFVPTKAPAGNSVKQLTYTYRDLNPTVATTQYRIKQVNKDGKFEYSGIRKINGLAGLKGAYVYPNPSINGRIRVFFDEAAGEKQVSLIDNTGRLVRKLNSKNAQQVELAAPVPGVYHVLIYFPATGEKVLTKVIVQH